MFGGIFMPMILKSVQKGVVAGAAILFICCLIIGLIQLFFDLSDTLMNAASVLILGISAYSSAYFSTQLCRSKGMLQGVLCGAIIFAVTLVISMITHSFTFSDLTVIKALFCLILGAVGGIKGVNTKKTNLPRRLH